MSAATAIATAFAPSQTILPGGLRLNYVQCVMGGEQDAVFSRAEQAEVSRLIEDSTLHLEPEVGHSIHWEMPDRFVGIAFGDRWL